LQPTHIPAKTGGRTLRYFFHFLSKGVLYEDKSGDHFRSFEEAIANARVIASQLGNDDPDYADQAILVTDAKGNEIGRVPIRPQAASSEEDIDPR
jgi:hypothetical protein